MRPYELARDLSDGQQKVVSTRWHQCGISQVHVEREDAVLTLR
jgi:hypothetical protein